MSPIDHPLFQQPWPEGDYRFFQLGFVVEDLAVAAGKWAHVFGVGPFHMTPVFESRMVYRGREAVLRGQVAVTQTGPVQIELYHQLCDTPSVYREWSRDGACQFHQLATVTPDYDGQKAHYEGLGYPVVAENVGNIRVAYIDTLGDFGFYTEVVEQSRGFLANLQKLSTTSATWDGTRPIRLLTPDGRNQ
jgi:hypothetical protein